MQKPAKQAGNDTFMATPHERHPGQVGEKSTWGMTFAMRSRVTVSSLEAEAQQQTDAKGSPVPQGFTWPTRFASIVFTVALVASAAPALAGSTAAPAFSVKSLEGRAVRLSDYRNRPVIVDFWATWCAPCRASMPHLNDLSVRYGPKGLAVIGMSVDDNGPAPVRRFANGLGIKFTMAMANDDILDAYGPIRSIPTTIFISRKGQIVRRVVGYIDKETLEGYLREIMP